MRDRSPQPSELKEGSRSVPQIPTGNRSLCAEKAEVRASRVTLAFGSSPVGDVHQCPALQQGEGATTYPLSGVPAT